MEKDAAGRTPLHKACFAGDAARVASLLTENVASALETDRYGHTAWHYAVAAQSVECIHQLRAHSPNSSATIKAIGSWQDGSAELKEQLPVVEFNQSDIHPSPSAVLSADRTMARNGSSWSSFRATSGPPLTASEWPRSYAYELELCSENIMQIGWATKNATFAGIYGVGDDPHGWAWDGCRRTMWHAKGSPVAYHDELPRWKVGDVLTFCVTFLSDAQPESGADNVATPPVSEDENQEGEEGEKEKPAKVKKFVLTDFSVLVNGKDVGIAWHTSIQVPDDNMLYPALSFERLQKVKANFGYTPFKYPLPEGCIPLSALAPATQEVAHQLDPPLTALQQFDVGSPLHWAAQLGNIDLLRALLEPHQKDARELKKLLLESLTPEGCTPAAVACRYGQLDALKFLLEYEPGLATDSEAEFIIVIQDDGSDGKFKYRQLQIADHSHKTPLIHACSEGHLDTVRYLLENTNASLEEADNKGILAANYAVASCNLELLDYLISVDPQFLSSRAKTCSPLAYAVRLGLIKVVRHLIEKNGADASERDVNGHTLLHDAAISGKIEIMQFLLENGHCAIDDRTKADITPILWACDGTTVSGIKYLISKGGNIHDRAIRNMGALFFAIKGNNRQVLEWLIEEQGFEVNDPDDEGTYPVQQACKDCDVSIVKYLISKGAKMDARGVNNYSALLYACTKPNIEVIKFILDNGYSSADELSTDGENAAFLLGYFADKNDDEKEPSIETLTYLESKGVDLEQLDYSGNNLLAAIGPDNRLDVVKWLVESRGLSVNYANKDGWGPLFYAVMRKSTKVALYLISKGADINQVTRNGDNIIMYAASTDNIELLQYLFSPQCKGLKISVNAANKSGMTPILVACKAASLECVQLLYSQGASLQAVERSNVSCLMLALQGGKQETVEWLLEHGFSIEERDEHGKTPIFFAALHSVDRLKRLISLGARPSVKDEEGFTPFLITEKADVVKYLLDNGYASIHESNNEGQTAIMFAASNGNIDLLEYLLSKGATLEETDQNGRSVFMYACSGGHTKMIKHLIEKGANVNVRDKSGMAPVFYAAAGSSLKVIKLLVENGARANIRDKDNNSPLLNAAYSGKLDIVKYLLSTGSAAAHDYNNEGMTAMMLACKGQGGLELVKLLHSHGALIDDTNKTNNTPLMYACDAGKLDVVNYLLENGASTSKKDKNGKTALFFALGSDAEIIRALIKAGADVFAKDDAGRQSIHYACFSGLIEEIKVLISHGANVAEKDKNGLPGLIGVLASRNSAACRFVYEQVDKVIIPHILANINHALYEPLFETLKDNTTIHTLDLCNSAFDSEQVDFIVRLLEHNKHLASLNIDRNDFTIDDYLKIGEVLLRCNRSLVELTAQIPSQPLPEDARKLDQVKEMFSSAIKRNGNNRTLVQQASCQMVVAARVLLQPHPITQWLDEKPPLPLEVIELVVRQIDGLNLLTEKEKTAIINYVFDKENMGEKSNKWQFLKTCVPRFLWAYDEELASAPPPQQKVEEGGNKVPDVLPDRRTRRPTEEEDEGEEEYEEIPLAVVITRLLRRLIRFIP